jgi:hypothetical protein
VNTDTTEGRTGRHLGRQVVRALAAVAFALLVLGATMGAVDARQQGRGLPQSTFMKNCRDSGGTVGSGAEDNAGSAWCTWRNPDGTIIEVACEFTGSYLWYCTGQTRITSGPGSPTLGERGNVVLAAKQSTGLRTQAANQGVSLEVDDDER